MSINIAQQINTQSLQSKEQIIGQLKLYINNQGFEIAEEDINKPWGAYFKLSRNNTDKFIQNYFNLDEKTKQETKGLNLDPKFLLVAPQKKLSWQYHFNRSEIWTVLAGPVQVITSDDDMEKNEKIMQTGEDIQIQTGERHRLVGLDNWGIVAEIWVHTNKNKPSDESDIIRVSDDFGRG
ncbi:MAG: phosphoheptose isomerase [bacterium]|nr:phosphoheptose isomerase [bacterium]